MIPLTNLQKMFKHKYSSDKNYCKFNILVNVKVLHIAYVIYNITYVKKVLWFFTIHETVIIILS